MSSSAKKTLNSKFKGFCQFKLQSGNHSLGTVTPKNNIYYLEYLYLSYICFACLFVCLFARLFPINDKTAEPIGPDFFGGLHISPGKVYKMIKYQKCASKQIRFLLNV